MTWSNKRWLLVIVGIAVAYYAFRNPVTTTLVTDQGHFIVARETFATSCMRVVAALQRQEAQMALDPWGLEHTIVAASCERGNETIGRAVLAAATEQ